MEASYLELTVRLSLALVLGGAIGIEREYRAKEAGFRTHFLVALGSALFCVVSQFGFGIDLKDSSRVAAQVVSGIGFLGAGTIIFQKNVVRGLTTAAGLWVTAAIGLACGTGMYVAAAIATAMVLLGLEVINALIPQFGATTIDLSFSASSIESVRRLIERARTDGIDVLSYEMKERRTSKGEFLEVEIHLRVKRGTIDKLRVIDYMNDFNDVTMSAVEG
uniref:MgtC/SapB family protein n=1 Tax=Prevotella sp. TaxID=59823 RepID=UPI003FF07951